MKLHTDSDVLIVGAGPVGLTLALLLAKFELRVAIYERQSAAYPLPRAVAMSHESARAYQQAGIIDALKEHMDLRYNRVVGEYFTPSGEVLMRQEFPGVGESGFPPMTPFNQPDVERTLNEHCAAHPLISLHRGWDALALQQEDTHASVRFARIDSNSHGNAHSPDGSIEARGRFVVGCDGANSTVRALLGTVITDTGFSSSWLVVDYIPDASLNKMLGFGQSLDPARPTTLVPAGRGRRRFEFMMLDGETAAELSDEARVWSLMQPWGVTPDNAEITRRAVYTFRGRWASDWRNGRVLLAGDAAHEMPPFMGQGFNSGVRDVVALAWRLDLILRGKSPITLLDSYTSERLPHVQNIVEQSVGFGHIICVLDPEAAQQRDAWLRAARDNPALTPPPPPPWRLGPGLAMPDDPHAGFLAWQANVEIDGRSGLFDDVTQAGKFVLLGHDVDPLVVLSQEARDIWAALGGISAVIAAEAAAVAKGDSLSYRDVDGAYAAWFEKLGAKAVLVRPDFHVFGAVADSANVDAMVRELGKQLALNMPERRGGNAA